MKRSFSKNVDIQVIVRWLLPRSKLQTRMSSLFDLSWHKGTKYVKSVFFWSIFSILKSDYLLCLTRNAVSVTWLTFIIIMDVLLTQSKLLFQLLKDWAQTSKYPLLDLVKSSKLTWSCSSAAWTPESYRVQPAKTVSASPSRSLSVCDLHFRASPEFHNWLTPF